MKTSKQGEKREIFGWSNIRCFFGFHHIHYECNPIGISGTLTNKYLCTGGCKFCGLVVDPIIKKLS